MDNSIRQRLSVYGQGYVGLPLSLLAAKSNFVVTGIDTNEKRVADLQHGQAPFDKIQGEDLENSLRSGALQFLLLGEDQVDFDVAVIAVPTPLNDSQPNMEPIKLAATKISEKLSRGACVILESTTWPGTTEEFLVPILEKGSGLKAEIDFSVAFSPERIDPGNSTWNLENTPKLVSGIGERSLHDAEQFYHSLGISTVPVARTRDAEMAKLIENSFRQINIAFINELARRSASIGVDIWSAISAAATKPFGFMRFDPGPGTGGHCLPVDPIYLSHKVAMEAGEELEFIRLADEVNKNIPSLIAEKAIRILDNGSPTSKPVRICIMGIAYKPGSGDTRESPSIATANLFTDLGFKIFGYDPSVPSELWPDSIVPASQSEEPFDLLILMHVPDDQFALKVINSSKFVLDTRNQIKSKPNVFRLYS